jgi:hypothetical protein
MSISKDQILAVLKALKGRADNDRNNPIINRDNMEECQNLGLIDGNRLTKAGENFLLENV